MQRCLVALIYKNNQIMVMKHGDIVEIANIDELYVTKYAYTKPVLCAIL